MRPPSRLSFAKPSHLAPRFLQDVVTGSIGTDGTPATVSLTNSGDSISLTFSETAGHYIYLEFSGGFSYWANLVIYNPDGTQLASSPFGGGYFDRTLVAQTGTYTISLSPSATGSATFTLFDVPADSAGSITTDGAPSSITVSTPGQRGYLTFSGTAGTPISVVFGSGFYFWSNVALVNPDGSTLTSTAFGDGFIDKTTLPQTGNYQLWLHPYECPCGNSQTGQASFQIWQVPADDSGTMTIGGSATMDITTPGQRAYRTFDGAAGQVVQATWTGDFGYYAGVTLYNPDGSTLSSSNWGPGSMTATLPATGTYKLYFSPNESAGNNRTGTATFQLDLETPAATSPPAISGTLEEGQTMVATPGTWSGSPTSFSYQWQRCSDGGACANITDATSSTYTTADDDVSDTLAVQVTAGNSYGTDSATSPPSDHIRVAHYSHSTSSCIDDAEDPVNLLLDYPRVEYYFDPGGETLDYTWGPTGGHAAAALAQALWNGGAGSNPSWHDYGSNGGCVDQDTYATTSEFSGHHARFWVSAQGRRPTGAAHHDFFCLASGTHSSDQWIESAETLAEFLEGMTDNHGYQPAPTWDVYQDRPYTVADKCGEQVPDDGYTNELDYRYSNILYLDGPGGGGLP
jgi:hypothetical protein